MSEYEFIIAEPGDIDLLVSSRINTLRAANLLDERADLDEVERQSRLYYERAIPSGEHIAYIVLHGCDIVGTGGVSFYSVMPTCSNPSGTKAYIMNMYTHPDHRRRGIARRTLGLLIDAALAAGVTDISLEATAAGRPLYESSGFVSAENEMIYNNER